MLDSETKRRIVTARDILVGKVPDPKSQVEQITIALIYKFMDDMDAQSEEFGGKRTFFAGDFERYGWAKLMRSGLGGFEMLNLYAEAIAKMPENPGIPLLFRNIFKNAYLPYRDPETLRAFLKIIDDFSYDHSERLGDAFEYLLSVLGSQGDAGQFRTPRHIIDFMVAVIDPKKNDTVLDPACGTAGFLISSYKHILEANRDAKGNTNLTPDERERLARNIRGYDISPDMVRLSLVNLYLHGFVDPNIAEYDTLTSQDKWNELADVILANPPFMSPKGGIKPHKSFSVSSNRSEVLFVDYMAEHLTSTGRAGIIVPEGIIFQSQTAYKQLRKMLVEEYLVAVVSLPAGVFNPYSGVKTSILILDKSLAKRADTVAFFKIEKDGYGLGAQRRALCSCNGDRPELCFEHSDIPRSYEEISEYLRRLRTGGGLNNFQTTMGLVVAKEKIAANGDYNLSGERYRESIVQLSHYPMVPIKEVATVESGFGFPLVYQGAGNQEIPFLKVSDMNLPGNEIRIVSWNNSISNSVLKELKARAFPAGTVIFPKIGAAIATNKKRILTRDSAFDNNVMGIVPDTSKLLSDYLFALMQVIDLSIWASDAQPPSMRKTVVEEHTIPLPPLEVQREIVVEIEGYQKVIDGARAVVESYRPSIPIDPDWSMVEIKDVCVINPRKTELGDIEGQTEVSFVPMADISEHSMDFIPKEIKRLDEVTNSYTYFVDGDVLLAKVTPCFENGKAGIARNLVGGIGFGSSEYYVLRPTEKVLPEWVFILVASSSFRTVAIPQMTGTGGLQRVPRSVLENYRIPLPSIEIQRAIITDIKVEQRLINANRELIERFEKKVQKTIARIWGE